MEEKEVMLESVEELNKYLHERADDKSVISIVLELAGDMETESDTKGGESDG